MPAKKVIFKVDARIANTDKVFQKGVAYPVLGITSKSYTIEYDSESVYKIPKDQKDIVYYAFALDEQEKSLREKILREEKTVLNPNSPFTQDNIGGIMEPDKKGEAGNMDKVVCKQCGTAFDRALLEKKNSLDKCLVCGEYFEDSITCPECNTTFKRNVLDKQKDREICPVCGDRLDGVKVKISKTWEMIHDPRFIRETGQIPLRCLKCESSAHVDRDKFEILTPEQCKLKERVTIRCNEQEECRNPLTSDYIVLAEKPVEPETYTVKCPSCGSHNVKKIKLGSKIMAAGLLDVLSVGYISKTFQCQSCKYTW